MMMMITSIHLFYRIGQNDSSSEHASIITTALSGLFNEFLYFTREHVCRIYIVIHVSLLRESIRKRTKNE